MANLKLTHTVYVDLKFKSIEEQTSFFNFCFKNKIYSNIQRDSFGPGYYSSFFSEEDSKKIINWVKSLKHESNSISK